MSSKKVARIMRELVGRKIKEARVSSTGASIEFRFTDDTLFSFVLNARPEIEIMFAFSGKDDDAITANVEPAS
jgi:hypothetical protein